VERPEKPEWFHLPEDDTLLTREINGTQWRFTKQNTSVYMFQEPYTMMNHIWYKHSEEQGTYLFDCEDIIEDLFNNGYTMSYPACPSDTDVECFLVWEGLKLESFIKNPPPTFLPE